jgi:hypothetical protein
MAGSTAALGSGFRRRALSGEEEKTMGREQDLAEGDLPSGDEAIEREAQKSREKLDEVPEHGTDPLNEGP